MNSKLLVICLILQASFLWFVESHTVLSSVSIGGTTYKEGDCIRPHPSSKYDYPINALDRPNGLQSDDMICGWLPSASKAANKKCPISAGSKITVQWHFELGQGSSDTFIIDPSHKGPCIYYMAKSDTGTGPVWFKIFEDGYDTSSKTFCVTRLKQTGGKHDITIPSDLAAGNYLLRAELIALHEGDQLNGAQPYVGCVELAVSGSGNAVPSANLVAFPGAYKNSDPGIHFDIYSGKITSYPIPGPKVYVAGSSTPTPPPPSPPPAPVTTKKASTSSSSTSTSTTGKSSTSTSTTGSKSTSTSTTGKSSTTTTGKSTTTTTGSNGEMCYLPNTPNIKGRINHNPPKCGKKDRKARCATGQCCSTYGYCGPLQERDGNYYEYVDGTLQQVTKDYATNLYCNNTVGDYRLYPCESLGLDHSNVEDESDGERSYTSASVSLHENLVFRLISLIVSFCLFTQI